LLPAGAFAGWDSHPLESAALSRRTGEADISRSLTISDLRKRADGLKICHIPLTRHAAWSAKFEK
jgi:hypothetical protein